MSRRRTPRVVIVGAGRMAGALCNTLVAARIDVAMHTRHIAPLRRAGAQRFVWVLAVPDAQIEAACERWAPVMRRGEAVLHLAGMRGPDALDAARAKGVAGASWHPLAAVAPRFGGRHLRGACFCVEGDPAAVRAARALCRVMKATLIEASAVDRARYHGGAALMATGAVALSQGAARMFSGAITPPPDEAHLRAAVASLLESVAANVRDVGVDAALASPLMRDDTETVARHLAAMRAVPAARAMYRAAVGVVVDTLETRTDVRPETLTRARAILAAEADEPVRA